MQRVAERLALVILVCLEWFLDVLPLRMLHVFCVFSFKITGTSRVG